MQAMMRIAVALMFWCAIAAAQEDQTPRPPKKDTRGLLQVNRDYYDLAAATGGDFYFWAAGEFATANLQIPIEHEEVVLSYGSFETERVFEIPVESGVRSLEVFAGAQRKDLAVLVRPDGVVVHERDSDAAVQSFQHMLIVTLRAPAAGTWRLELHGAGVFCVTAHVKPSDDGPELVKFDRQNCEAEISGKIEKPQVEFVAKDGSPIAHAALQRTDDEHYSGHCSAPGVPSRVAITGVDANGKPFRRVERGLR